MREFSMKEREQIQFLTNLSIEMTYLEPTETGLEKSIMDATAIVRSYLLEKGIHDYSLQSQGEKSIISAYIITESELIKTKASLYRPKTKQGDPRIWFYSLHNYSNPNDIIAIISNNNDLFVVNLTQLDIRKLYESEQNPVFDILNQLIKDTIAVANELLSLLKTFAQHPIPTVTEENSDTGVGRTLETLLGIEMNSKKTPDYKGIELKSARTSRGKKIVSNRKNLFSQVPDWNISQFSSSHEIIQAFGYIDKNNVFALRCTVNAKSPNSQGLQLRIDDNFIYLHEFSTNLHIGEFITWKIEKLHNRLRSKHRETFWIDVKSIEIDGVEHFIYQTVKHTKSPIISQFVPLIIDGDITVDHMITVKNGKTKEKGPAFKLKPSSMGLLFPDEVNYQLA